MCATLFVVWSTLSFFHLVSNLINSFSSLKAFSLDLTCRMYTSLGSSHCSVMFLSWLWSRYIVEEGQAEGHQVLPHLAQGDASGHAVSKVCINWESLLLVFSVSLLTYWSGWCVWCLQPAFISMPHIDSDRQHESNSDRHCSSMSLINSARSSFTPRNNHNSCPYSQIDIS